MSLSDNTLDLVKIKNEMYNERDVDTTNITSSTDSLIFLFAISEIFLFKCNVGILKISPICL